MKILVASTYLPPRPGGAERVAWETSKRLAKSHEVHLLTTEEKLPETPSDKLTVHRVRDTPAKPIVYAAFHDFLLRKIARETGFDVIHCHIALPWGYIFRTSRKLIVTCHGADVYRRRGISRWMVGTTLGRATAVTSPSKWLANWVQQEYGVQSQVIPNGVDTERFTPDDESKRRENVVLYVGRLLERKGILDLLDAAKILKQYEFWIAGDGPLMRARSIPNAKWLGYVSQPVKLYNMATICVFPSHWEPFGLVGLEAMACGRPIIATTTGFSDFVEHAKNGMLIPPHDSKQLVSSITSLMSDRTLRERIGREARLTSLSFDWEMITRRYEDLYDNLIKERAS